MYSRGYNQFGNYVTVPSTDGQRHTVNRRGQTFQPIPPANQPLRKLTVEWNYTTARSLQNPAVWGPAFWFSLHNGAMRYPEIASRLYRMRMRDFIRGLPYMIPCAECAEHAKLFINSQNLAEVVHGRESLIAFYVKMHNKVNERYGKQQFTVEEVKNMYSQGANIRTMQYR